MAAVKNIEILERIEDILKQELAILELCYTVQTGFQTAVLERRWIDFEASQEKLAKLCMQLEMLESERVLLFENKLGNSSFYRWTSTLPADSAKRLRTLYHALKQKKLHITYSSKIFAAHLERMQILTREFMESAYPDRRGKLYGRAGRLRRADMRRMVLDKQF